MEKFTVLTGVAAPLLRANVNTDVLIRIERLMFVAKGELGPYCFEAWRYRPDGAEDPDFVLNKPAYRGAKILLAAENFGCGSSREQAVWSLWDMGFRCVIAPSFGDIFFGNCFQNGMLPIVLPAAVIAELAGEIESAAQRQANATALTIDLERRVVVTPSGREVPFAVDAAKRQALLDGLDEIGTTLRRDGEIAAFQSADRARRPWIYRF
jgi:3-isopropylmalate/(R)-2-methylmalate dehydratase small subunit